MSGGGTPPVKPSPDLYVNMGLPSGKLWAKTNLDASQANGFSESEFEFECSYVSWGNLQMHNPVSASEFDYDWGAINEQSPWYEGQPYGETAGSQIQSNIGLSQDIARIVAGSPWRMPSADDFVELFQYSDFINADGEVIDPSVVNKVVTVNGIKGIYLKSKINGARLFFACCGTGSGTSLNDRTVSGNYWSSTWVNDRYAKRLVFNQTGATASIDASRFLGYPIRPVWVDVL